MQPNPRSTIPTNPHTQYITKSLIEILIVVELGLYSLKVPVVSFRGTTYIVPAPVYILYLNENIGKISVYESGFMIIKTLETPLVGV